MSLSCSYNEDGEWYYFAPDDYSRLDTKRARHCCSCKALIKRGDVCLAFPRVGYPEHDSIEYRIYGDEKPLATWYMCEPCGDQYFNLEALGFCINLPDSMDELRKEYVEMQREFTAQRIVNNLERK